MEFMRGQEQTILVIKETFDFFTDFWIPILIGVVVTLITGAIVFLFKRMLKK